MLSRSRRLFTLLRAGPARPCITTTLSEFGPACDQCYTGLASQQSLDPPCRRVMHIPIGFAPLPIIHNFKGEFHVAALHLQSSSACSMAAQQKIAALLSHHDTHSAVCYRSPLSVHRASSHLADIIIDWCMQTSQKTLCSWMRMPWLDFTAAGFAPLMATSSPSTQTSRAPLPPSSARYMLI